MKIAKEDGKVTEEEEQFLSKLKENILKFQSFVHEAIEDNTITEDEFQELVIRRDKILIDALDFSTESEDINKMVIELYDKINDFQIPGMADDELIDE